MFQAGATDFSGNQCLSQSLLVDDRASRRVDDQRIILHLPESFVIELVEGFLVQADMDGKDIAFTHQRVKIDKFDILELAFLYRKNSYIGLIRKGFIDCVKEILTTRI